MRTVPDRASLWPKIVAFTLVVLVVAVAGWLVGGSIGSRQRDDAEAERRELSRENDRLGATVDASEDALDQLSDRAKELKPSITGDSGFMATGQSVKEVDLGDPVTDDGDTGTVTGVRVVDRFTSAAEYRLPGAARKGLRWLVVGGTYRTGNPTQSLDACGGDAFVTAVFTDGTTLGPDDVRSEKGLPRYPGADKVNCFEPSELRGADQPLRAVIAVPEGSEVRGLLVGDMWARALVGADRAPKTKLGWLEFDRPLEIGAKGDAVDPIGKKPSLL